MLPTRALGIVSAGLLLGGLLTTAASDGPEGEQVVHGDVQFSRDGHRAQLGSGIPDVDAGDTEAHFSVTTLY